MVSGNFDLFRWDFTAYDDAKRFKHDGIADILLEYMKANPPLGGLDLSKQMKKLNTEG